MAYRHAFARWNTQHIDLETLSMFTNSGPHLKSCKLRVLIEIVLSNYIVFPHQNALQKLWGLQNAQCPTFEKLTSEHLGLVGLLLYTKEKLNEEEPESKLN